MRLTTPLGLWSATFFTTLGLTPLVACGGTTVGGTNQNQNDTDGGVHGGTGGNGAGGATGRTGGYTGFAGGTSSGGRVSDGGFTGSTGGNPYDAGGYPGSGGLTGSGGNPGVGGAMPILSCGTQTMHLGADGRPSGFIDCQGGSIHRLGKYACATVLPRAQECPGAATWDSDAGPPPSMCWSDAGCTAHPNGHCESASGGLTIPGCYCQYGCISDSDCSAGQICLCGDPVGQCVNAACTVDADCGSGNLCLSYTENPGCGGTAFACQTAGDTCISDADCTSQASSGLCSLVNGAHQCSSPMCAIGRPFLVGGAARLASAVRRDDWCSSLAPAVRELDRGTRDALATRWTEIALMEHASIAAFARFAMEIMSLGAPPELVRQTHAAMADETIHARDAFALASAYAGAPIGPGQLDVESALLARSPLDVVATTILEGCIGETVAAVEAAEALARATDPAVREALARVTMDETRHAELAWRFVQWVLEHDDARLAEESTTLLVGIVEAEACAAAALAPRSRATAEPALLAHGVLPEGARAELRARVLSEIVAPCARALARKSRRASAAASRAAA